MSSSSAAGDAGSGVAAAAVRVGDRGRSGRGDGLGDRGEGTPAHDLDRDGAIGMASRDPRRRHRHRRIATFARRDALGVGDVQLHHEQVVDVVEAGGSYSRELAELELEVVDRPDGLVAEHGRHRLACFAS